MPNPGSKDYCKVNPFESLSELMRLLQNPLHLRILIRLARSPLDVSDLQEALGREQSDVSHALAKLKGCGALESERVKKRQIYHVSDLIRVSQYANTLRLAATCRDGNELNLSLIAADTDSESVISLSAAAAV